MPAKEDGNPDMCVAAELAGWLKLSTEAYEARGTETPDEEIRRTALACRFEHRGGMLPTLAAARGFLSVRLLALRPVEDYVEGGDVAAPVPPPAPQDSGAEPVFLPPEAMDSGQGVKTDLGPRIQEQITAMLRHWKRTWFLVL